MHVRSVFVAFSLSIIFFPSLTSADTLPVRAFASLPDVSHLQLSPSGNHLLFLSRIDVADLEGTLVNVVDLESSKRSFPIRSDNKKFKINWVRWANDKQILISTVFPAVRFGTPSTETRLLVHDIDKNETKNVLSHSFYRGLQVPPQFQDEVIDYVPEDPDSILLSVANEKLAHRVYRINLNTRRRQIIQRERSSIIRWYTDRQHRVRVGMSLDGTTYQFYRKAPGKKTKWVKWLKFEAFSEDAVWPLGFDKNPNVLYVSKYHNGLKAIFKTDLTAADPKFELVYADEEFDVNGSLLYSKVSGQVIGTTYNNDSGFTFWDEDYKNIQKALNKALPDTQNYIVNFNDDESKAIVVATSDTDAGSYYLFDLKRRTLSFIASRYRALDPKLMAEKTGFSYRARDGLNIDGFLSLPKNAEDKPLPTIIFPHGGPISHDTGDFDYWTQFFANRGYAVLQMNFRGSSGYGYDFMKAGLQSWGQAMQDDVEDGARALIAAGIAHKNKIGIAGASYGGYAALMGAIKSPDLYQCVISFAGVTDVAYFVSSSRDFLTHDIVKEQIGSNKKLLKKVSPVNYADQINVPVLLMHGDKDRRVRVKHGRKMYKKLKSAGKQVEYIEFDDGDHYLSKNDHRIEAFSAMDRFLAKYLPVE